LEVSAQVQRAIDVLPRYLARIDRLGDDLRAFLIRTSYVSALVWNARYREAAAMQRETSRMADRLGDAGSKAWALDIEIWLSTVHASSEGLFKPDRHPSASEGAACKRDLQQPIDFASRLLTERLSRIGGGLYCFRLEYLKLMQRLWLNFGSRCGS
jgi:hypothetical protein